MTRRYISKRRFLSLFGIKGKERPRITSVRIERTVEGETPKLINPDGSKIQFLPDGEIYVRKSNRTAKFIEKDLTEYHIHGVPVCFLANGIKMRLNLGGKPEMGTSVIYTDPGGSRLDAVPETRRIIRIDMPWLYDILGKGFRESIEEYMEKTYETKSNDLIGRIKATKFLGEKDITYRRGRGELPDKIKLLRVKIAREGREREKERKKLNTMYRMSEEDPRRELDALNEALELVGKREFSRADSLLFAHGLQPTPNINLPDLYYALTDALERARKKVEKRTEELGEKMPVSEEVLEAQAIRDMLLHTYDALDKRDYYSAYVSLRALREKGIKIDEDGNISKKAQ
jgi:hypothetical protein